MSNGWLYVLAAAAVVLVAAAALAYAVRRGHARTAADLAASHAEAEELRARLARLERRLDTAASRPQVDPDQDEYVITGLDTPSLVPREGHSTNGADPVPTVEPRLFADIVLRESTIHAASFVQGLRRALAAETRNRIRFEMRREVRRARKQRKAELREARRDLLARRRAETGLDSEGSAA